MSEKNSTVVNSYDFVDLSQWLIDSNLFRNSNSTGNIKAVNDDVTFRLLQVIWTPALRYSYYTSSALFPVAISIATYFICQLICTFMDILAVISPSLNRYRIQPEAEYSWSKLQPALLTTFWNHILYILPASIAQWSWTPETPMPPMAPTLWEFCWHQYAALMILDAEFYIWHVLHHKIRFLYRHVHSVHHRYIAVNSWATQYVHPWELYSIGIMTTTAPWMLKAHPLTSWCFMAFVLAVSVEDHCGYDLPIMPHHWAPFWGGSRKHDMHHQRPLTNFQPYFNWFDRLFGNEYPTTQQKLSNIKHDNHNNGLQTHPQNTDRAQIK